MLSDCLREEITSFFFNDQIVVVKWHDRKDVHATSTPIGDDLTTVKRRGDTIGWSVQKLLQTTTNSCGGWIWLINTYAITELGEKI